MTHTLAQFNAAGEYVAILQTGSSRDAYRYFNSIIRYMQRRQGQPMGFFDKGGIAVQWWTSPNCNDWRQHLRSCFPLNATELGV